VRTTTVDVAALLRPDEGLDATEVRELRAARAAAAVGVLEDVPAGNGIEARWPGPAVAGDETVRVARAAARLGVEAERFERYAEKRWGRGWKMNANDASGHSMK
jgi:hypothetical protein